MERIIRSTKTTFKFLILLPLIILTIILLLVIFTARVNKNKSFIEKQKDRIAMASLLHTYAKKTDQTIAEVVDNLKPKEDELEPLEHDGYLGAGQGESIDFSGTHDGLYLPTGIEDKVLTPGELQMLGQYASIMETAARQVGVPSWAMYAIHYWESSAIQNPVTIGSAGFSASKFGTTHPSTGKVIDFYNYGTAERRADGALNAGPYVGPFQLDKAKQDDIKSFKDPSQPGDIYNLADASIEAAQHLKSKYNAISGKFGDLTSDDIKWVAAVGAYNSGEGAFSWRYPDDSITELEKQIRDYRNLNKMKKVAEGYYLKGRADRTGGKREVFSMLDLQGWRTDQNVRNRVDLVNWTQPLLIEVNSKGMWPGNGRGERKYVKRLPTGASTLGFFAYEHNGIQDFMAQNYQNIEYLAASYSLGTMIRDTLVHFLGDTIEPERQAPVALALEEGFLTRADLGRYPIPDTILLQEELGKIKVGQKQVLYNWEIEQLKNGTPIELIDKTKATYKNQGELGEVGYKGTFPIFVQGTGMNDHSNITWKFRGNTTTLGSAGCSLYSLTSLIHGAGLGTRGLPNYPDIQPTLENLAKILDNGPITSNHVSNILGYDIAIQPTDTKKDLDELWESLRTGVPWVVNVNSKEVTAYDEYLRPHKTKFTTSGHFIILSGGFEMNNKRYVEVVQSTGSNAGMKNIDQNRMVFDYDELVSKKVLRSSHGYPVPAYTILGTGSLKSQFLTNEYKPPTRVEQNFPSVEIKPAKEDLVIDLYKIQ